MKLTHTKEMEGMRVTLYFQRGFVVEWNDDEFKCNSAREFQ